MEDLNALLMKETEELLNEFKDKLIQMLINDRMLDTSSNTINSLKIETNLNSKYVELTGVDYFYYVVHGRGAGRFPPPDPVTGKWKIPFPVAREIAEKGNKDKYKPIADKYDKLFQDLIKEATKISGKTALAYINNIGTIGFAG